MLQPKLNLGIELLIVSYMKGKKAYPNTVSGYVDVQDVARAHVLVYETPHCAWTLPLRWHSGTQALGMKFTPLKESLHKTVVCLQAQGHIPIVPQKSAL
nr:unnamed protein product [Digitaria exilis]